MATVGACRPICRDRMLMRGCDLRWFKIEQDRHLRSSIKNNPSISPIFAVVAPLHVQAQFLRVVVGQRPPSHEHDRRGRHRGERRVVAGLVRAGKRGQGWHIQGEKAEIAARTIPVPVGTPEVVHRCLHYENTTTTAVVSVPAWTALASSCLRCAGVVVLVGHRDRQGGQGVKAG